MRRAAAAAAIRINQIAQNDTSDSDQNSPSTDSGMIRAANCGYDSTIYVVRFLLDELNNAKFEDQRCEITEKMLEILNKNPNVLIYEPKFRDTVTKKLNEIQEHINNRADKFQIDKQQELIRMMAMSTRINVRNSEMRHKIYKNLTKISNTLKSYKEWTYGTSLKTKINNLHNTLEIIKNNPAYVVSSPILH